MEVIDPYNLFSSRARRYPYRKLRPGQFFQVLISFSTDRSLKTAAQIAGVSERTVGTWFAKFRRKLLLGAIRHPERFYGLGYELRDPRSLEAKLGRPSLLLHGRTYTNLITRWESRVRMNRGISVRYRLEHLTELAARQIVLAVVLSALDSTRRDALILSARKLATAYALRELDPKFATEFVTLTPEQRRKRAHAAFAKCSFVPEYTSDELLEMCGNAFALEFMKLIDSSPLSVETRYSRVELAQLSYLNSLEDLLP